MGGGARGPVAPSPPSAFGTSAAAVPGSSSIAMAASASAAPPSIRAALENMSPGELWAILSELKSMASSSPEQAHALLGQYPMLAHAIVHIQAMLGTLATPTSAYAAALAKNGGSLMPGDASAQGAAEAVPVDEEQKALVKSVLAMSDAEVAAMPTEQREGVEQIRLALGSPLEVLEAMEGAAREELLQLREQLTQVLAAL